MGLHLCHKVYYVNIVKLYFGKNTLYIGVSWFSSVPCTTELLKRGLYFTRIVKGHSSKLEQ